jgi:hypothetical protein
MKNLQYLPSFYIVVESNPTPVDILMFLIAANIVGQIGLVPGAFEIYKDDNMVHSTIESGDFPTIQSPIHSIQTCSSWTSS